MKTNRTNNGTMATGEAINVTSAISATEERASASEGEPSEPERVLALSSVARTNNPDPEVAAKPMRRRFSAEYKIKILQQADGCTEPGQLGALLRREGLYASNLITWRRQREQGQLAALSPQKRGRKQTQVNPLRAENERLHRENQRLQARLKQAEMIIDVQKKVSQLLGISLPEVGEKS